MLGLLDFGQRQWWIPASILPTERRPWTLGRSTTLWFVLTVFLVLWSSGLPRPTGLPLALSLEGSSSVSQYFPSETEAKIYCKLLDSTKIRSPSCLDPRTDGFGLDSRRQFVFSGAGDHRRGPEAIRAGMAFRSRCRWTFRSDSCSAEAPRWFSSWIASRFCSRDCSVPCQPQEPQTATQRNQQKEPENGAAQQESWTQTGRNQPPDEKSQK